METLERNKCNVFVLYDTNEKEREYNLQDEDDRWDLEDQLNESRKFNKRLSVRVKRTIKKKRLEGKFIGGHVPYGVRYDKETATFTLDPVEIATMKKLFELKTAGWGIVKIKDYFDQHPEQFPKRKRKNQKGWYALTMRAMINNDFYFTGVISGNPPVDTGLKDQLFDEEVVMMARREMSVKRQRGEGRGEPATTIFTDALLHGIVRCGVCDKNWKLGLQIKKKNTKKGKYRYYKCRAETYHHCNFGQMPVAKLDKYVWGEFVKQLQDPQGIHSKIMKQEFIVDKDRAAQQAALRKAEKDLAKLEEFKNRIRNVYEWGDSDETEYREDTKRAVRLIGQKEQEVLKLRKTLEQPLEVTEAVKRATEAVADQVKVLWTLEKLKEAMGEIKGLDEVENPLVKLRMMELKEGLYEKVLSILEKLEEKAPIEKTEQIDNLIYQQRRLLLQTYLDADKGIKVKKVKGKDKIEVEFNFKISSGS